MIDRHSPSTLLRPKLLGVLIACVLSGINYSLYAAEEEFDFNTDLMDSTDRANIDLSLFSKSGFILPGTYELRVQLNEQELSEFPINYYPAENDPKSSMACLSPELVTQLGLRTNTTKDLTWWRDGECLDISSVPGMTVTGDLSTTTLYLQIPKALLEYYSADWVPPARWENGLPGILFDYNINTLSSRNLGNNYGQQKDRHTISGNGVTGLNMGAWRLRADWQMNHQFNTSKEKGSMGKSWDFSRYYAFRALPSIRSSLTLGESYLNSEVMDSFRFTGVNLRSDDNMLPPNLRQYSPEVTGIARTNAKVIVSHQGQVLYETQVAAGPFKIQDLNSSITGKLDVRVEENDGEVQTFQIETASVPYLTRPGLVRYKFATGKPSDYKHRTNGPMFAFGEFSWGVSNGWSLYGGAVGSEKYNSAALGIGRDLLFLGAISFDVTTSRAKLGRQLLMGNSYRLSYSKNFDEYDSQITFAGYRFSERDFLSMNEYLSARKTSDGYSRGSSKELYTITMHKTFRSLNMGASVNYNRQTYWNRPLTERYGANINHSLTYGFLQGSSISLSAYRTINERKNKDNSLFLSLSIPLDSRRNRALSYSMNKNGRNIDHMVGYYERINDYNSYQLNMGKSRSGLSANGYLSHTGSVADLNANVSYQEKQSFAAGLTLQGGITATTKGLAAHRVGSLGGTRLMLDTDGVANIPISNYGQATRSNIFGKAVVGDIGHYQKSSASIDVDNLQDDVDVLKSVVNTTLTEGAIGYRRFNVISGTKVMAVLRLPDGSSPPFGAVVYNSKQQELGIVYDNGNVYLSGVKDKERLSAYWDGVLQCTVALPDNIAPDLESTLLLPCVPVDKAEQIKEKSREDELPG